MKVLTGICLLLVCSFTLATEAEAQAPDSDEAAIRSALAGYAAARQRRDAAAQGQFYALDADFGPIGNPRARGREEIETSLRLPGSAGPSQFALDVVQVRFLSPTIALVDAVIPRRRGDGYALYVMAKEGDEWLIKAARVGQPRPRSN